MAKCMQCGGATKMKKMKMGGAMGIVGMPKYSNDPRTDAGRTLKKGGSVKKYQDGGQTIPGIIKKDRREIMRTPSGKAGVIISTLGSAGIGAKMIADKIKSKKAEKKAAEEKSKKEAKMPKAQYGKIVKTAAKYISPAMGAAKSATKSAKIGVKQLSDKYKKVKADNYKKKTSHLRRIEDWENFANQESAKKLARTGVIGLGGLGTAAAIADKYKSKTPPKKK
jgi:ribosomal protein S10